MAFGVLPITSLFAQENSPYSRYALGDQLPSQNIATRGMGGLSIPYYDLQSVNSVNPASYAQLKLTTFDIGLDLNTRTLVQKDPAKKYNAAYLIPSYMMLGFPMSRKGHWGMALGLRPLTRINYDLFERKGVTPLDSVGYQYKGSGGTYQAFVGMGFGWKRFTVGFNTGYKFGNKSYSTGAVFINDTVQYKKSLSTDTTRFGGIFLDGSLQYTISVGKNTFLRFGATYGLTTNMKAQRDISRETITYSATGTTIVIDSVYRSSGQKGTVVAPGHYGAGFLLEKEDKWLMGVEYSSTLWSQYKYYEQTELLRNNWTVRLGGQFTPDASAKNYWARSTYRAGFTYGNDLVAINDGLKQWSVTVGARFPLRRNFYTNQYTSLNTALEWGTRGSQTSSLRDNFFRISVGFALSDVWFQKRKYD